MSNFETTTHAVYSVVTDLENTTNSNKRYGVICMKVNPDGTVADIVIVKNNISNREDAIDTIDEIRANIAIDELRALKSSKKANQEKFYVN